jgi:hypothetical protein
MEAFLFVIYNYSHIWDDLNNTKHVHFYEYLLKCHHWKYERQIHQYFTLKIVMSVQKLQNCSKCWLLATIRFRNGCINERLIDLNAWNDTEAHATMIVCCISSAVFIHVGSVVEVALGQLFLRDPLFFPVNINPSWLSMLIYHLRDEQ